jgi:hypothetical protein
MTNRVAPCDKIVATIVSRHLKPADGDRFFHWISAGIRYYLCLSLGLQTASKMAEDKSTQIVFDAISEVNQQLPPEKRLEKSASTRLVGDHGRLDSFGLVLLIVAVEKLATERLGRSVVLTDDETLAKQEDVFESVAALADHLRTLSDRVGDD